MTDVDYVEYQMEALDWVPRRPAYDDPEENCEIIVYCTTLKEVISVYEVLAVASRIECVSTYKKRKGGRHGETLWEWFE